MVDMAAIGAAATALNTAINIAKAAVGLRDAEMIRAKVLEMQGEISSALASAIAAQTDQFAMLQRVQELEKEVARLKSWETEKERYELKKYAPGVFFYTLKESEARSEPIHSLCAKCYEDEKKSIVHVTGKTLAREPTHFVLYAKRNSLFGAILRTPHYGDG